MTVTEARLAINSFFKTNYDLIPTNFGSNDYLLDEIIDFMVGGKTTDGIPFNNVFPSELGPIGSYFQTNILATFEYEHIQ